MVGAITSPYVVPRAPGVLRTNLSRPSRRRAVVAVSGSGGSSSYWAAVNADVETHLRRALEVKQPLSVYEPLHQLAFAAPPTSPSSMAPALCVAAYEVVGGENRDEAAAVAAALRLLYTMSYTHEPFLELGGSGSMTRDPYGSSIRLLTGDGMVPFAMKMLARANDPDSENSGRILRIMIESGRAIGSRGVVEGQYREAVRRRSSDGGGSEASGHVEEIRATSEKIEGEIYASSAACGAILGGGSEDEIDRLRSYGLNVGKIVGFLNRKGGGEEIGAIMKEVEEMKDLAIKGLRSFEGDKVEAMCSLIDAYLGLNHVYDTVS